MKRFFKKILLTGILFLLIMLSMTIISNAASFSSTISKTTVNVGDTITVNVKATNAAGMYEVKISDESILSVSSGAKTEFIDNTSAKIVLKANKAGTVKVTTSPKDITDNDDSTKQITTGGNTYTVTVKEKASSTTTTQPTAPTQSAEKSKNANLATLGVTPKEYDFKGFDKNKTEYSVTVPNDVESLKVTAIKEDKKAAAPKITGNSGFEVGSNNKITIKVTAEDGKTTKTYTIKVTRLAEDESKPGNIIEDPKDIFLQSLEIEGLELSPSFAKDVYSYKVTLTDGSVTELKINAKANDEKAKIEITGNKDLVEGENTINIIVTTDESDSQKVYQIIVNKTASATVISGEPSNSTSDLIGKIKSYALIGGIVVALVIIAIIVLIVLLRRENKKENEEYIEEDDDTEENNIYNSKENEFDNDKMEKDNFIQSLYNQRNGEIDENLTEDEKETLEEISNKTAEIFEEKVEGQSVEYSQDEDLEIKKRRKDKGRHSL